MDLVEIGPANPALMLAPGDLCCLNAEGFDRFLCAGKPVSEPFSLGGEGSLVLPSLERSAMSRTKPKSMFLGFETFDCRLLAVSSSESKSSWNRWPLIAMMDFGTEARWLGAVQASRDAT